MKKLFFFLVFVSLISAGPASAQTLDNKALQELILRYQADRRGPFKDIRWFCEDGSVIPPKEKCPEPGGVQRARYKDEVVALGQDHHLFIGQILSNTPKEDFWDTAHQYGRLKQYQLEQYLRAVDDGWIWRKAQFYRGAVQVEDEENWGLEFLQWALEEDLNWEKNFFLLRQAAKDIPHRGDNPRSQLIRALSKEISENYLPFQDLRVKIHGQPEASDIQSIRNFRSEHEQKLNPDDLKKMDRLILEMEGLFADVDLNTLEKYLQELPAQDTLTRRIKAFIHHHRSTAFSSDRISAAADLLWDIRELGLLIRGGAARLALLDISNDLEEIIFKEAGAWQAEHPQALLEKICYLNKGAAGAGFIELWEYEKQAVAAPTETEIPLVSLNEYFENNRRYVEWGAGMTRAVYGNTIQLFSGFEPKATGFSDDRIRSSILLPLGQSVSQLGDFLAVQAGLSNQLMDLAGQREARGLNAGYARGELVIVEGFQENVEVDPGKIYLFERPPTDLKPVAGIATVSEGNMVSHVQLLARNLGIPNAVISKQNLEDLRGHAGRQVFYAVSNNGTILMKPATEMTTGEQLLFAKDQRNEQRIAVPVDKLRLEEARILDLRELRASDSGVLCGPKAANLGQLKQLFPDMVVEGLVIPFGVFRQHLEQFIPGTDISYWQYLNNVFLQAGDRSVAGSSQQEVEAFMLEALEDFRQLIKDMALLPGFETSLREAFQKTLGGKMGSVPVFVRSDTNMEDLKEFTGAGLNLTLFNVVDADRIWQGIKEVWASPYTERSYKWRQRYLLNPENVFPSILIIPSVDVEYSGVMITKGITNGREEDITVAFSRGAGGAVDGQVAESYLLHQNWGDQLLFPAREIYHIRLPESGGTQKFAASFETPILQANNLNDLRELAAEVKRIMPETPGMATDGPFDIELGFKDQKIWLFQIRPFVENKRAAASAYLESITPVIPDDKMVRLRQPL